jgi:hypothetical protein
MRTTYIDPALSPVEEHQFALTFWSQKRGSAFAPRWGSFDLLEFPPSVIPRINVVDFDADTDGQIYRFWGTALTAIHGGDFTGFSPVDVPTKRFGESAQIGYARLVMERVPNLEVKEFTGPDNVVGRELILRLPLTDDGEIVSHGLAVCYYEISDPYSPLHDFFNKILQPIMSDED